MLTSCRTNLPKIWRSKSVLAAYGVVHKGIPIESSSALMVSLPHDGLAYQALACRLNQLSSLIHERARTGYEEWHYAYPAMEIDRKLSVHPYAEGVPLSCHLELAWSTLGFTRRWNYGRFSTSRSEGTRIRTVKMYTPIV